MESSAPPDTSLVTPISGGTQVTWRVFGAENPWRNNVCLGRAVCPGFTSRGEHFLCISFLQRVQVARCPEIGRVLITPICGLWNHPEGARVSSVRVIFFFFCKVPWLGDLEGGGVELQQVPAEGRPDARRRRSGVCWDAVLLLIGKREPVYSSSDSTVTFLQSSPAAPSPSDAFAVHTVCSWV